MPVSADGFERHRPRLRGLGARILAICRVLNPGKLRLVPPPAPSPSHG